MDERSAEEEIEDLRRIPERRGVGEEGRTKEEQDRAMSGAAPAHSALEPPDGMDDGEEATTPDQETPTDP